MTVSRALRTPDLVAQSTAARIRTAIAELGYRPDPALSALAAYRSRDRAGGGDARITFLDCDGTEYSRSVLAGATEEAALHGYDMERIRLPADARTERRIARSLFHRGVRGLLFGPSDALRQFGGWDWSAFAAVSLSPLSHSPGLHAVAMDYFDSAMSACEYLRRQGATRIGLAIDRALEARTGHRWLGGYAAWTIAHGGLVRAFPADLSTPSAVRKWARDTQLDGLLTIHAGYASVLKSAGVRVAFLNPTAPLPGHACYSLRPETIGREGVRFLHHLLLRREFGIPRLPSSLALRGAMVGGGAEP